MGKKLGLDLGVASIGWSLIDDEANTIIATGVRKFKAPEDAQGRKTNRSVYAENRSKRKTGKRKKNRLLQAMKALLSVDFLPSNIETKQDFSEWLEQFAEVDVWDLRLKGLDEALPNESIARIFYHLCKHRGFRPTEKEVGGSSKEEGKILKAISLNENAMSEMGARTLAELVVLRARKSESETGRPSARRNREAYVVDVKEDKKTGELIEERKLESNYSNSIHRKAILEELRLITQKQLEFKTAVEKKRLKSLSDEFASLIWDQKHFMNSHLIKRQRGNCTFYKQCPRAALNSPIFEQFKVMKTVNNIRINGRKLTDDERAILNEQMYQAKTLTFKKMRQLLGLHDDVYCNIIGSQDPEKDSAVIFSAPGYFALKKVLSGDKKWWTTYSRDLDTLTRIAEALTVNYEKEELVRALKRIKCLSDAQIEALMSVDFSGYARLSNEVMKRFIKAFEGGMTEPEAVKWLKLSHRADESEKQDLLPIVPQDISTSQHVIRTLSQARRIINALVKKYGTLDGINIEFAREISMSKKALAAHNKRQGDNKKRNDAARTQLAELLNVPEEQIKSLMITKYKLWEDQNGRCVYTGDVIPIESLLSGDNLVQIDHILPYSRSFNDSFENKVLCKTQANQDKGSKTPMEWFATMRDSNQKIHELTVRVTSQMKLSKRKQSFILMAQYEGVTDFLSRHLNLTREIDVALRDYIEDNLKFTGELKQPVKVYNGSVTAMLRKAWGLFKDRDANDLHHAVDASIVALANPTQVKVITQYYKDKENGRIRNGQGKVRYLERLPWKTFREDLDQAIDEVNISMAKLGSVGRIHKDTISKERELVAKGRNLAQYVPVNKGYAEKENAVRYDLYRNTLKNKLELVAIPPHLALIGHPGFIPGTDEIINESYLFVSSFSVGDYVEVELKNGTVKGYLRSYTFNSAIMKVDDIKTGIQSDRFSVGSMISMKKYTVNVLGEIQI